jgi:glycosyltransferase involved in cell wall biosynthesis
MKLSVVVPARDEAGSLGELLSRLDTALGSLDCESEIILVDDGSRDRSWPLMQDAAERDPRIRALRLSRNYGHQIALTAGLWAAEGDAVVTMDSDLQHPPEMIGALVAKAREGYDVVYAVRGEDDAEGWFKTRSARVFYWVLNKLTALDLPAGGADFRYMSRRVVAAVLSMPERHRFLRGMTRWVGYTQASIEYDRGQRLAGKSKYSLRHMLRFAFDAIFGFSALPLKIASVLGLVVSFLGGLYFVYVVLAWALTDTVVAGWTSVIVAVLLLGGVQLACIGIVGQYLGRMYEEIKGRPLFLVWEDTRDTSTPGLQYAERTAPLTGRLVQSHERYR